MDKIFNVYDFFSLDILVKSWFAPWKDDVSVARNVALQDQISIWEANFSSRFIGFFIRTIIIFVTLIIIGVYAVIGLFAVGAWVVMPLLVIILPIIGVASI